MQDSTMLVPGNEPTHKFIHILEQHRSRQKVAFSNSLKEVLQYDAVKQLSDHLKIDKKYEIMVINNKYKNKTFDSATHSYSQRTPIATLFGIMKQDRLNEFRSILAHWVKTGTYIIAVDKYSDMVISGIGFTDGCEIYD
eukprot:5853_1